ncbi:4,5-DOPA dioxygenase extradiol [Variovorax dokdonensis]|uniref:4,5-DOPA dioxygenase extradiol n=1 Tax=Variovorax dokdonensis TaxID=344883 RepID=A0ABT7NGV9_9BURK|nr:4,5-DOPA dioxygenase extradiol [Variovorax dokdonensis]MDM0047191.1 4,5-DOPA dioxygenase extradiol [Variovorax dokdonensis]
MNTPLRPSPTMPVMFIGHGSPMNAIEDNHWRAAWQSLGTEFGERYPTPQLILCISAHWLTRGGWFLTGMAQPRTIHDFGGFPQELFAQQYPAPGAPQAAEEIAAGVHQPDSGAALGIDADQWGLDHGAWSVLKPMFPQADIPVVQLSMNYARPPAEHFELARQLRALRDRGVLIVGSGNVVHNLRQIRFGVPDNQAYDWAVEFDAVVSDQVKGGRLSELVNFQQLGAVAQQAHPTYDHYLPLLYAAAAVDPDKDVPRFFNEGFQAASISMRSMVWA